MERNKRKREREIQGDKYERGIKKGKAREKERERE